MTLCSELAVICEFLFQGLSRVVSYLMEKKHGHGQVILVNLRNDITVECDSETFCVHHAKNRDEPVLIAGATGRELEVRSVGCLG